MSHEEQCGGEILAVSDASGCAPQFMLDCNSLPVMGQPTWSDCAQEIIQRSSDACEHGPCGTLRLSVLESPVY